MAARPEPSLRAQALRFLARREHSREELRRKLAARADPGEDIEGLLDDFAARGWLSDLRFAESASRARSRRFGPLKVAQWLKDRGVADETIAAGLKAAGPEGASRIASVWASRFRGLPADAREKARQVRFLQGRGFALGDILRFLGEHEDA